MVDRDGLENRCTFTGTVGSNPTLSANPLFLHVRREPKASKNSRKSAIFAFYSSVSVRLRSSLSPFILGERKGDASPALL